ncbi:hypothetical protein L6452_19817 [Arctium lappa]|uniref:Uncharacterized protein n=1 Tax=Arctium lappa TaxID=4217 RepID=A0ACB9BA58_ARCLA|nr:hypothetical protein L6452_19817 [Arctium lappa]
MECNRSSSSSRVDRRTIEKNRRIHMKALYSQLHSLVPHDSSREMISLPDQLQEAASYIKKLQIKLEKMNEEKDNLMGINKMEIIQDHKEIKSSILSPGQQISPQINVRETGSSLEAILITGIDFKFLFTETIRVIHEEGFDVVNASFSILNDKVFHTIHAQIGGGYGEENGVSRIVERLNSLVYGI